MILGFVLAFVYSVVGTWILFDIQVSGYPEIEYVCSQIGQRVEPCVSGAAHVGLVMTAGLSIAFVIVICAARLLNKLDTVRPEFRGEAAYFASLVAAVICAVHALRTYTSALATSRIAEISSNSVLISFENLLWPLLLQLFISSRGVGPRLSSISALLLIADLSPFRGVIFGVTAFGVCIPLLRAWTTGWTRKSYGFAIGAALGLAAVLLVTLLSQTAGRLGHDANEHAVARALIQRIVMPLFQAHAVERVEGPLPGPVTNMSGKLRLSRSQNLNQALYQRLYGANGGAGETTVLFYGEGAAYWSRPLLWTIVAPLVLATIGFIVAYLRIDAFVLVGVAIWRGSLGGMTDVLPALFIQVAGLAGLMTVATDHRFARWLPPVIGSILLGACALTIASGISAGGHIQSIGTFKMSPQAAAAISQCGNITGAARSVVKNLDTAVPPSAEVFEDRLLVHVAVQKGLADFAEIGAAVARECGVPAADLRFVSSYRMPVGHTHLMDWLAAAASIALVILGLSSAADDEAR